MARYGDARCPLPRAPGKYRPGSIFCELWQSSNTADEARVLTYSVVRGRGRSMRKIAIGLVAIAALIGTPALAADMATKAPPVTPPVPTGASQNWYGFYIGAQAGYGWDGEAIGFDPSAAYVPAFAAESCRLRSPVIRAARWAAFSGDRTGSSAAIYWEQHLISRSATSRQRNRTLKQPVPG